MNKPQADQFRQQSPEELRRMYQAGKARRSTATIQCEGACYLCMRQIPAGQGRIWKLLGAVQGTRILCSSCDAQVQTRAPAAPEEDAE